MIAKLPKVCFSLTDPAFIVGPFSVQGKIYQLRKFDKGKPNESWRRKAMGLTLQKQS
jgi:hypothetical protein